MNVVRYAAAGASALAIIAGAAMPANAVVAPPPVDCLALECGPAVVKPQPSTLTPTAVKNCISLAHKNQARLHEPGLVVHPYYNTKYKTIPVATLVASCLQAANSTTSAERANTVSWAYAKLGQRLTGVPQVGGTPTRATLVGASFAAAGNPVYVPYPAGGPKIPMFARNTVSNDVQWAARQTQKYGTPTILPAEVSIALPPTKPGDVVNVDTLHRACPPTGYPSGPAICYPGGPVVGITSAIAGLNGGNGLTITMVNSTVTLVPTAALGTPGRYPTQIVHTYTMPAVSTIVIKPPMPPVPAPPNPTQPPNAQPH